MLDDLPENATVVIDATKTHYIHYDVLELIREFKNIKAPEKNINCILTGFKEKYKIDNTHNVISENPANAPQEGVQSIKKREHVFN